MAPATSAAAATSDASGPTPTGAAGHHVAEDAYEDSTEMDTTPANSPRRRRPSLDRSSGRTAITVPGTDDDADAGPRADEDAAPGNRDRAGWIQVVPLRRRKNQAGKQGTHPQHAPSPTGKPSPDSASQPRTPRQPTRAQFANKVNAVMTKTARMPNFASRDENRVVVRPRGGLVVGKVLLTDLRRAVFAAAGVDVAALEEDSVSPNAAQNILVISTPSEERTLQYELIQEIAIGGATYEAYAYRAAPEDSSRGVIRGVGLEDTAENIHRFVVNRHNPTAMDAHRLGKSTAVVILFDGGKVPSYVRYGGMITRCYLYRQHREVCKTCGQVGHRKDVCPTPTARVCFACGQRNPGPDHEQRCKPNCKLCGGPHATGTKSCKNKFKTPFQVKKRQWQRKLNEEQAKSAPAPPALKVRISRRDDFPELDQRAARGGSREKSRDRSASGVARGDRRRDLSRGPTWATVAVGGAAASSRRRSKSARRERSASRGRRASRSGSRHNSTRRPAAKPNGSENAELREMVNEMRATIHEQRITIERLSKQLEELRGLPKKGLEKAQAAPASEAPKPTLTMAACPAQGQAPRPQPQRQQAAREPTPGQRQEPQQPSQAASQTSPTPPKTRVQECEEREESEEEIDADEDDAESVVSSASAKATGAAKTPGYAGLSNRCRRLENQMNRWGKDLENMEKRLTNRIDRALNQMMQQVNQAVGQMTQLQQQLQQQFSPENMKTLKMNAIQEHFDNGASQQHSP